MGSTGVKNMSHRDVSEVIKLYFENILLIREINSDFICLTLISRPTKVEDKQLIST